MRLVKCYVSSFGKLNDFTFEFSKGVNTIKEDNGWGKSTLATFIKAMFYGLSGAGKRSVNDNERIKYKPWNSTTTFGGYVEFVWGDKEYKLERYFGNKESEDTVRLTDIASGRTYEGEKECWGKRIFEIDEEGFLSTTYLSQKDFEIKSNTSITAKYNSICEVEQSDSFNRALNKIDDKIKRYKSRGDKGLIFDARREVSGLEDEILKATLGVDTSKNLEKEIKKLEEEIAVLKNEGQELTSLISKAGQKQIFQMKKDRLDECQRELYKLISEKNQVEKLMSGKNPTESELLRCNDYSVNLSSLFLMEKTYQQEIENLEKEINKKEENKKQKYNYVFLLCSALLLVIGCVGFSLNAILAVLGLVFSAVFIALFFILKRNTKDETLEFCRSTLYEKRAQLGRIQEQISQLNSKLNNYFEGFIFDGNLDYSQMILQVRDRMLKIESYERKIKELNISIANLKPEVEKIQNQDNIGQDLDLTSLEERLRKAQAEQAEKTTELERKKASASRYEEASEKLVEMESRKSELLENIKRYKEDYEILCKTNEFLRKADENLKLKYRAPLQESLNKYLSFIDKEKSVKIDIDLNITAIEKNGEKNTEYYSKGYQNLFEICKRFALTDVLFTGEKPFIILDDPFYNLDDDKIRLSIELIKKMSEEYQILYFVCHESRRA